ncbi:MAG: OmpA family protein [Bacteroidota bacterium]
MKTILLRVLFVLVSLESFSQQAEESIWFATADDHLSLVSMRSLEKITALTRTHDVLKIEVSGNTDNVGSTAFNEKLAGRRVQSATAYLISQGVPAALIATQAFGELKPRTTNKHAEGRRQNRRVDIVVTYREKQAAQQKGDIRDLYRQLATQPNEFCINPKRDTVLRGRDGGIIEIKANSFQLKADNGDNCVTILLRENFSYSSMLLDNLTTMSNGKILESDGMVDVAVYDWKGRPLGLNQGKDMVILVPTEQKLEDIQFFDGQHGPDGSLNWNPIENLFANQLNFKGDGLDDCIRSYERRNGCRRCRFFCRLGRLGKGIKGISDVKQRQDNKDFRRCQKRFKRKRPRDRFGDNCRSIDELLKQYGVSNLADLNDTLRKVKLKEFENAVKSGEKVTVNDLNYYAFSKSSLGLANCDRFSKYDPKLLTTLVFDQDRGSDMDIKVAFEKEKIIIPANGDQGGRAALTNVPKGQKVWVIAFKVIGGAFFMDIFQTVIGDKTERIHFKKASLQEIQDALKRFDLKE